LNLRLAYSANAYMRFDVFEAIRRIAALGYRGIELMADTPHLWPQETSRQTLDAVRNSLDEHSLTISNINAFMMNRIGDKRQPYWHPSWIEPDPAYRQIRIDHTKAALTMARYLGAPNITTEPGGPLTPGASYSQSLDLFVEMLKPIVEHAEREGVRLLVEPEPDLLIERFDQYLELRDRIESPFMRLNFDIGHAYCVSEDPELWIERMRGDTDHYHFEDIAMTRVHKHLIPGQGAIDFRAVLAAIGPNYCDMAERWITVELYPFIDDPDAAGREAKDYLERIAATL
jgi:sugar phosphate isomerase/epimerase